jgi:hypothetical protein
MGVLEDAKKSGALKTVNESVYICGDCGAMFDKRQLRKGLFFWIGIVLAILGFVGILIGFVLLSALLFIRIILTLSGDNIGDLSVTPTIITGVILTGGFFLIMRGMKKKCPKCKSVNIAHPEMRYEEKLPELPGIKS